MIKIGNGVSLYSLKPQALLGLLTVNAVFEERVDRTAVCMVSSANDRRHGLYFHLIRHPTDVLEPLPVVQGSYHYEGLAFDIDWDPWLNVSDTFRCELLREIKQRLGGEYDACAEDLGTGNSHLHVEWDRRRVEKKRLAEGKLLA